MHNEQGGSESPFILVLSLKEYNMIKSWRLIDLSGAFISLTPDLNEVLRRYPMVPLNELAQQYRDLALRCYENAREDVTFPDTVSAGWNRRSYIASLIAEELDLMAQTPLSLYLVRGYRKTLCGNELVACVLVAKDKDQVYKLFPELMDGDVHVILTSLVRLGEADSSVLTENEVVLAINSLNKWHRDEA